MEILSIKTDSEILEAYKIYYNSFDKEFINISERESLKSFRQVVRLNKFIKCIKRDNKIIAWLYADTMKPLHMSEIVFSQLYYGSCATGILAYKCVVELHKEMIIEASKRKIRYSISQGSPMDEHNTFARILEKNGWRRRGHTAVFELPQQGPKPGNLATFLSR